MKLSNMNELFQYAVYLTIDFKVQYCSFGKITMTVQWSGT